MPPPPTRRLDYITKGDPRSLHRGPLVGDYEFRPRGGPQLGSTPSGRTSRRPCRRGIPDRRAVPSGRQRVASTTRGSAASRSDGMGDRDANTRPSDLKPTENGQWANHPTSVMLTTMLAGCRLTRGRGVRRRAMSGLGEGLSAERDSDDSMRRLPTSSIKRIRPSAGNLETSTTKPDGARRNPQHVGRLANAAAGAARGKRKSDVLARSGDVAYSGSLAGQPAPTTTRRTPDAPRSSQWPVDIRKI
jgi:hypothetical protein